MPSFNHNHFKPFMRAFTAWFALLCLCMPIGNLHASGPGVDELLMRNAEFDSMETLDVILDSDLHGEDERPIKSRQRMCVDRALGKMAMLQLDPVSDEVMIRMMVEGGRVSYQAANGNWRNLPMNDTVKDLIAKMGYDLDEELATMAEKRSFFLDKVTSLQAKISRRFDRQRQKIQKMHKRLRLRREPMLDQPHLGRRAIVCEPKEGVEESFDQQVMMVDEDSGLTLDRGHYVRAEKFGNKMNVSLGKARRRQARDGHELIEVLRQKAIRQTRVNGVPLIDESETVNFTGRGEIKQKVRWRNIKANMPMDAGVFRR